ncbi:MAG: nicotinate (nicotinamide) nucleotide adenylyltransferase [Gemmatimonadetes bacterium]|nr:nicotinate (nicotinamide) nucleotide adenylyltransferase [Gemmatimonadota bacterium]MYA63711.1 nicotinate (nicotinamide) nucleotide adenylyltransferase [Gemmatimonadota bacterium]MYB99348.1 nicotinate (nicotinamide) nucleotide adenylyltransferase [Gemmatimonadota bacterium]MYH52351.1 nicotinate (nicotinamide) nucleotide adenylyltransferase [Gemmatimonadota bacterium]MYI45697.1 nicotinate (nicotinamide) nucleotide adenylyltransferase [Gemmatimonadota bacterium]
MVDRRRVGIFGGTFDPPHLGHSIVAAEVMEALRLDRLLWVPAAVPPHKRDHPVTSAEVRRRMVAAAVAETPGFALCDLEVQRGGVSYTVDTLRRLRSDHPAWSLFLIIGADLLEGFASWKEPDAIRRMARLVAISRGATAMRPGSDVTEGVRTVRVPPVDISSSEVRRRVAGGKAVSTMVAAQVLSIIESERLYRTSPPGGSGAR